MRLMHVVVVDAGDPTDPLAVYGFFISEQQALEHAHQLVTGRPFVPTKKWLSVSDWHAATPGVSVTRFVAAHAPTGKPGRQAAA